MSGRRLVTLLTGLVVGGSVLATSCSTSNSATVTSTPTPASTVPFETPTPSPSPSVTPQPTASSTASRSPGASPNPSPTASVLAKPANTYALVRGLGTTAKGRYTITYDPVVLCTKQAVTANEAPKQCTAKPAKTAADGSWTVRTTTMSVSVTLAPTVSGTLYPAGVPFAVTAKNLATQKARNGVLFDWSTITVPALLVVEKNEINTVTGARPAS